jgi:hypothetical protein
LSRPPAGREHAEDLAVLGTDHSAVGQPPVQRVPQVLAQWPDHRGWFPALVREDDLQGRVEDRVTGRGPVPDKQAPRLALILLTRQAHLVPQGEFDQVRAPQTGIDRGHQSSQPATVAVGYQQQKVLGEEHADTLPWCPITVSSRPGRITCSPVAYQTQADVCPE